MSVSVKDISFESFVSDLLFIGIDSEIQSEGVWVEGKGFYMTYCVNKIYLCLSCTLNIS